MLGNQSRMFLQISWIIALYNINRPLVNIAAIILTFQFKYYRCIIITSFTKYNVSKSTDFN